MPWENKRYTNDEIIGNAEYGAPFLKINDVMDHPARNIPKVTASPLGLIPIGPNHDLGDE